MLLIPQRKFKMKNHTQDAFKKFGFRPSKDSGYYYTRFAVHRYKNTPVLFCELVVDSETGFVKTDVYSSSTEETWPAFYSQAILSDDSLVSKINHRIIKKMSSYGIKEVKKNERKNYFRGKRL